MATPMRPPTKPEDDPGRDVESDPPGREPPLPPPPEKPSESRDVGLAVLGGDVVHSLARRVHGRRRGSIERIRADSSTVVEGALPFRRLA